MAQPVQPVQPVPLIQPVHQLGGDEEVIEVRRLRLCDLFPVGQLKSSHYENKYQTVLKVMSTSVGGGKFVKRLHDAVSQIYQQTARRHRRLAIEDDLFFHGDKVQRVEQARKYYRDGTRLYQPFPSRKKPLSTLLHPTTLQSDKKFVLRETTEKTSEDDDDNVGAGGKNTFPGSVPVSMMEADIQKMWDCAYLFVHAPKTNGLRFFAVGCHFGHFPWMVLINRSQQVFLLPGMTAPDVFFDGTVSDGELVATHDGKFAFISYECAMSCGVPCSEYNYLIRLQTISLLTEACNKTCNATSTTSPPKPILVADEKDPLQQLTMAQSAVDNWQRMLKEASMSTASALVSAEDVCVLEWRVKRVFSDERFYEMLMVELPMLDHDTDGFISTAVEPPIQIGQTSTIFKIKRSTDHTLDFLAVVLNGTEPNPNILYVDLVALNNRGISQMEAGVLWDTLQIPASSIPAMAKRLGYRGVDYLRDIDMWLHGKIVECRFSYATRTWEPEGLRHDKNTPNKVGTAEKTWKNVVENLSLMQIFPEGSLSEETRKLIRQWESTHPSWKPLPTDPKRPLSELAPTCMAPASLAHLITFK